MGLFMGILSVLAFVTGIAFHVAKDYNSSTFCLLMAIYYESARREDK